MICVISLLNRFIINIIFIVYQSQHTILIVTKKKNYEIFYIIRFIVLNPPSELKTT
jgi:hypothetical protein